MARYLTVVERAYRGSLEEQYAHILWLHQVLRKMRGEFGVLLSGNAVLYAQRHQQTPGVEIGGVTVPHLPQYGRAVSALLADGVEVWVSAEDTGRFQLPPDAVCPGVRMVSSEERAALFRMYDRVWYW